jgi:cyclomaltodextrinase
MFKNAIIYQILIDRFSGCNKNLNIPDFLGGNLNAITEKLDYLFQLGINTIWLSPFYETHEYHGYHITDFKNVDPHFGSINDLQLLINKAHEKGIMVIADFVPNHCSMYHPFFHEAQKDINSKYYNWFYFIKWPDEYLCFLDHKKLPKLNLDYSETREYIVEIANYWLSLGIDGYRVDHVIGPSHDFWNYFYTSIKNNYPNSILFGEAWGKGINSKQFKTINIKNKFWRKIFGISQEKLQQEYYGEFDGILDFTLNGIIIDAVKKGNNLLTNKKLTKRIEKHLKRFHKDFFLITFLDNHDMDRFLRYCEGDLNILLDAFELLLTLNQPVVIYYGTENGVYNKIPVTINHENSDLYVREPFNWNNINYDLNNKLRALLCKNRMFDQSSPETNKFSK